MSTFIKLFWLLLPTVVIIFLIGLAVIIKTVFDAIIL